MYDIVVQNLTKDYGFNRGVFNISFHVSRGEIYGFLGPNGAGKSTTIRHLMGFSKPDSGKTQIFGLDTFQNYNKILHNVGYVPGEITLPVGLNGWEFIDMMKKIRKISNDERIKKLIELFELNPDGEIKRMSLGEKRKLAILSAFMHDPQVLILDEPTSGLDPIMQEVFIQLLRQEKAKGKTILLSSHVFSEVEAVCDRVSIIKNGKIVDEFPMSKLKHSEDKVYQVKLENIEEAIKLFKIMQKNSYIDDVKQDENKVYVFINDKYINNLVTDLSQFRVSDFIHEKVTLEEYFMQYYKDDIQFEGV
ncbi:MAG TPA: ABC transporter ATP-binding protein [Bacilli bacterium]|nr:ABC transporter ATP-binding protein [Bacilli bacterium]HQD92701.1 ABC transporter ATP-binding protein [Bacilli bacterium]